MSGPSHPVQSPQQSLSPAQSNSGYKRASRKGAPRRYACHYESCDKVYSRREHLQRHQLNHTPKEVFSCDVDNCGQRFVRADLLARHKKRHSSTYVPRTRVQSFVEPGSRNSPHNAPCDVATMTGDDTSTTENGGVRTGASAWPEPHAGGVTGMLRPDKRLFTPHNGAALSHQQPLPQLGTAAALFASDTVFAPPAPEYGAPHAADAFSGAYDVRQHFTSWLFDTQAGLGDFSVANLPFLDGGLESTFNNNITYDHGSLASRTSCSHRDTPPCQPETSDELVGECRRQELVRMYTVYRKMAGETVESDTPLLSPEATHDILHGFWVHVAPRVPIIHQPTFSCNGCPPLLLLVLLAVGAAARVQHDPASAHYASSYNLFSDTVITNARFAILTSDEASPPVSLWVAQALLFIELYEKMLSTRRLHERSHIYHCVTLTLLRRGSPLIGRSGSESPPGDVRVGERAQAQEQMQTDAQTDAYTWWMRWAETEAMHRVVFAAFCLDVTHAAMFGHMADMSPHEIRLPLPCDDNLWTAAKPDGVRQLDNSLRMYGIKPITFLDGLKRAVHGKEVQTHSFGRMIIMSGLLSVGWHLRHRETHLQWLDLAPPRAGAHGSGALGRADVPWRKTLLAAFDCWKTSFDADLAGGGSSGNGTAASNSPFQSAALLYHLAHLCLHVNIVDCQVYAGARRLLGRKVTSRDYTNVVARMEAWARQPSTTHAVLHAFRLLYNILVDRRDGCEYVLKDESEPHRPWIMYYAALSIWSFAKAGGLNGHHAQTHRTGEAQTQPLFARVATYLSKVVNLGETASTTEMSMLADGLPDLLDYLQQVYSGTHSELLQEAQSRLQACRVVAV